MDKGTVFKCCSLRYMKLILCFKRLKHVGSQIRLKWHTTFLYKERHTIKFLWITVFVDTLQSLTWSMNSHNVLKYERSFSLAVAPLNSILDCNCITRKTCQIKIIVSVIHILISSFSLIPRFPEYHKIYSTEISFI